MTVAIQLTAIDGDKRYPVLYFWCPGCEKIDADGERTNGLHSLPVNTDQTSPAWDWDGNLEKPTLTPSILTRLMDDEFVCHSFLKEGWFHFLEDSTHQYAGQVVPMPHLPEWVTKGRE